MKWQPGRGFVLLPVTIALTLVGVAALGVNRASALSMSLTARSFDTDAGRYVAEAGLAQLEWELQKKNCVDYTNLNAVSFASHLFDAKVSRNKGQPVNLQSIATTATGGSVKLDRKDIKVYGTMQHAWTIRAFNANGKETHIASNSLDSNMGAEERIRISHGLDRSLVEFSLGDLPAGAKITAAQLSLYQTAGSEPAAGSSTTILLHRLTKPWVEGSGKATGATIHNGASYTTSDGTASWATLGGDYDPVPAAQVAPAPASGWRSWDVTGLVRSWLDGTHPNYGALLLATGDIGTSQFVASDDPNATANYPKLTVTFQALCDTNGVAVLTRALAARQDAGIRGSATQRNYGGSTALPVHEGDQNRALFQFDLTLLPAAIKLQSAKLRVHVPSMGTRSGTPTTVSLHALTASWVEGNTDGGTSGGGTTWIKRDGTFSWITAGSDYRAQAAASFAIRASFVPPGWVEFDVKGLVQEWIDGVTPNNGLVMRNVSSDRVQIGTREAAANWPQLVISY